MADEIDKHEEFWFEDGDLILLVDKVYFKVHRVLLANSCGVIRDMLALPVDEKQPDGEGSSIERPVPIHDVSFDDFEVIVRDAYNRQPVIDFKPDAENMAGLARAAHRLQATRVLVLAATEAMKHMSPSQSLSLYSALGFDMIGVSQKTENIEEINRRKPGASKRAADRGRRERQFEPQSLLDLAAKFAAAFFEVVTTSSLALPLAELDDKLNLHLLMARAALIEERRKRLSVFVEGHVDYDYHCCEIILFIADLDVRAENAEAWYNAKASKGFTKPVLTSQDLRALIPTEAEDRIIVQKFSSKFK